LIREGFTRSPTNPDPPWILATIRRAYLDVSWYGHAVVNEPNRYEVWAYVHRLALGRKALANGRKEMPA
jgi:hypothetical protein